jgi:hypothetical protein
MPQDLPVRCGRANYYADMVGSGPDDGDVLALGPERPPRRWAASRRSRLVLALGGVCALLVAAGALAAVRLDARGPAEPDALAKLVAEVTTVPLGKGPSAGPAVSSTPSASSSGSC